MAKNNGIFGHDLSYAKVSVMTNIKSYFNLYQLSSISLFSIKIRFFHI